MEMQFLTTSALFFKPKYDFNSRNLFAISPSSSTLIVVFKVKLAHLVLI